MAKLCTRLGAVVALAFLTACAAHVSPQARIDQPEVAALASLKTGYPDIVVAFNIYGQRLDISIDANGYISTGDDAVAQFKTRILQQWRTAWTAAHPHQHALLTVRLVDFMGRTWSTQHIRA
jgi:hypothetical protein